MYFIGKICIYIIDHAQICGYKPVLLEITHRSIVVVFLRLSNSSPSTGFINHHVGTFLIDLTSSGVAPPRIFHPDRWLAVIHRHHRGRCYAQRCDVQLDRRSLPIVSSILTYFIQWPKLFFYVSWPSEAETTRPIDNN